MWPPLYSVHGKSMEIHQLNKARDHQLKENALICPIRMAEFHCGVQETLVLDVREDRSASYVATLWEHGYYYSHY